MTVPARAITALPADLLDDVRRDARLIVRKGLLGEQAIRWVDELPAQVVAALHEAEAAGVACDTSSDPIFYQTRVDFLSLSANLGAVCGAVVDAISAELIRHQVDAHTRRYITSAVRASVYGGSFDAGLAALMRWVDVDLDGDNAID